MNRTKIAVAATVCITLSALFVVGLGPLDPPAGPVTPTSPSLAQLDQKIDQVISGQGNFADYSGPWQVFRVPAVGGFTDNEQGTLIAEGNIYVHSVTSYRTVLAVFDGQGSIDADTDQVSAGDWIARSTHEWSSDGGGTGKGQLGSVTIPVQQIVQNGLYVAWDSDTPWSYLYVLYKELP